MPRIRWQPMQQGRIQVVEGWSAASALAIQNQIGGIGAYNANGAQKATTTLTWPPAAAFTKSTTNQMHAEMVALDAVLPRNGHGWWTVNAAGQVQATNGVAIGPANYTTNLPHCGHCTIMLFVLNLPLIQPTDGRYNYAVNLDYPVPYDIRTSAAVLGRLLTGNVGGNAGLQRIYTITNEFVNGSTGPWVIQFGAVFVDDNGVHPAQPLHTQLFDFADADTQMVSAPESRDYNGVTLLGFLWKLVFKGMYQREQ